MPGGDLAFVAGCCSIIRLPVAPQEHGAVLLDRRRAQKPAGVHRPAFVVPPQWG